LSPTRKDFLSTKEPYKGPFAKESLARRALSPKEPYKRPFVESCHF